jgi:hypothetical protein
VFIEGHHRDCVYRYERTAYLPPEWQRNIQIFTTVPKLDIPKHVSSADPSRWSRRRFEPLRAIEVMDEIASGVLTNFTVACIGPPPSHGASGLA